MSRPRNNLDELKRKHALHSSSSSPSKPSTPHGNTTKAKFKPAKSIPATSSTPSNPTRKLPSFSTPGWNKVKPPPLKTPSTADNSVSYINISSASESSILDTSTSSIPVKRLSSGSSDDLFPEIFPPKRPKTTHVTEKENIFDPSGKGKGRARDAPRSVVQVVAPAPVLSVPIDATNASDTTSCPNTLRAAFEALSPDVDLHAKSERELRASCDTAQDLIEACDKLIGAARADPNEPRDLDFLIALSDYFERRQNASRSQLRAIQRGERSANARVVSTTSTTGTILPTRTSTPLGGSHDSPSDLTDFSLPHDYSHPPSDPGFSVPVAGPSTVVEANDADDQLWESFADDPIDLTNAMEDESILIPATPPATQPRSPPPAPIPELDPKELRQRPYYPKVMKALKITFGLEDFRPKQLEAVCAAMDGRDVFVLFPTGSGKSLTFQIPAVCQDGVTVVISPLVSLMGDQVRALQKRGVNVVQLSGSMRDPEKQDVKQRLRGKNKPSLLYITPEQLQMSNWMRSTLEWLYTHNQLSRFVIDEAHCISDWGRRFRDSYTQLTDIRKLYPNVPISALTATANPEVEQDIVSRLCMKDCVRLRLSFNRINLYYEVRPKKSKKTEAIAEIAAYIKAEHSSETGIVYCLSRNSCEEVAKSLRETHDLKAKHYHAMMDARDRERVQDEWYRGEVQIIVATIAFGMGIDKPDVRFVVHYNLPATLANYYQETGRAGRDGLPAMCILYYTQGDVYNRIDMIRKEQKPDEEKRWMEEDFWNVVRYCTNDVRCRREQVLAFFEEKFDPALCAGLCNNCRNKNPTTSVDYTADAINALRLLENLTRSGLHLTRNMLVGALRGSKAKAFVEKKMDKDPCYGPCKSLSQNVVERLVDEMLIEGIFTTQTVQTGEYSTTYLVAGSKAEHLRSGKLKLNIELRTPSGSSDSNKVTGRQRKPRSKAAALALGGVDSPSAGPSTAGPFRARRGRAVPPLEEDNEEKLSLYRDDPIEDPDFDDIEEISSPVLAPRRMGTRTIPSASQSLLAGMDSDIEEVDPPVPAAPRVTIVEKADIEDYGDVVMKCKNELEHLREHIRTDNYDLAEMLNEEVIGTLAAMMPNDIQALRQAFDMVDFEMDNLGVWQKQFLSVCTKYHMRRG